MDFRTADQLGRELAWAQCHQVGIVSVGMAKEAGLLEGLLFAPLTAIAAMMAAPSGSRMRSMGMGLLLGAGMGAVSNREVALRNAQGEQVTRHEMSPAMKAIMAGVAMGGAQRVQQSQEAGQRISPIGAMLAGAPLGAMLSSDPTTGMVIGGISGSLISSLHPGASRHEPLQHAVSESTGGELQLPQAVMEIHKQNTMGGQPHGPIPNAMQVQMPPVGAAAQPPTQFPQGMLQQSQQSSVPQARLVGPEAAQGLLR